jgi:hypothetical protein
VFYARTRIDAGTHFCNLCTIAWRAHGEEGRCERPPVLDLLGAVCRNWKATVIESTAVGAQEDVGIEATGETRGAADDAAESKLRRLLQVF